MSDVLFANLALAGHGVSDDILPVNHSPPFRSLFRKFLLTGLLIFCHAHLYSLDTASITHLKLKPTYLVYPSRR